MHDLVLLRHGHALSTGEAGVDSDALRPLSEYGLAEAARTAQHLKAAGFRPGLIISSPLLRAAATADIAAALFPEARRLTAPPLSDGDIAEVLQLLSGAGLRDGAGLLVVGHQPLLGILAGCLLGRRIFSLSPAGFVRLTTGGSGFAADPAGTLAEYYVPPGNAF